MFCNFLLWLLNECMHGASYIVEPKSSIINLAIKIKTLYYRISRNIDEHYYIWRFAQKMLLAGF